MSARLNNNRILRTPKLNLLDNSKERSIKYPRPESPDRSRIDRNISTLYFTGRYPEDNEVNKNKTVTYGRAILALQADI